MKRIFRYVPQRFDFLIFGMGLLLVLNSCSAIRPRSVPPAPTLQAEEYARQVVIRRDVWGIPHIYGKTDNAATFGLAYAHAEDDFPLIQANLVAARGKLSLLKLAKISLANDYLVQLLDIPGRVEQQYLALPSDFRGFLEAYAEGINYYAHFHPEDVDSRFFPVSGKDIVAGFVHKLPLLMGVGNVLGDLFDRDPARLAVDTPVQKLYAVQSTLPPWARGRLAGSNAHAVGPSRSADGKVRLNINSHQPWEGPVSWYEAHVVSEEGWDAIGGTFPGAPVILHGHNRHLGWAHTVNRPDFVDVYKLDMHPDGQLEYRFDDAWLPLTVKEAAIEIDLGLFTWTVHRPVYASVHGPVIQLHDSYYAIRYAGADRHGFSVLQWYRMNKADSFAAWKEAMAMQALPMMNTVYGDSENIYYVYNALLPVRSENFNWLAILPGDTSAAIWTEYLPFDRLPQVLNPPSGLLLNTNSSPFQATVGDGNPDPDDFSPSLGIDTVMNNRAIRSHELFGRDPSITQEEFFRYKFDRAYSRKSAMYQDVLFPLFENIITENKYESQAIDLLKRWDGRMDETSAGATLARLTYEPIHDIRMFSPVGTPLPTPEETFRAAVAFLRRYYGRVDVPLGDVQRLRRGETDLPVGGGKDVLNAVHTREKGGKRVGWAGDSYILIVEFSAGNVASWAIHQYGNVNRENSPHYDDQAPLFIQRKMRKSFLTRKDVLDHLDREYHPGQETARP